MSNLLADNIYDKDQMKSSMTEPDPEGYSLSIFTDFLVNIGVTKIVIKQNALNDSFVLGHASLGILGTSKLGDRRTQTTLHTLEGDL